ncbi:MULTISPECIES: hypothetical protein [Clostridium]|uniref:hypothetical protein n=1 Tax=Clostridium TaxID=1485 RepID=UPI000826A4C3|nr:MULTISPECIES: hypothetical protein [Clostridium]PJI09475.1 hypothetical protein CUB90_17100 [Clostridium sp. CT7]
MAKPSIFSSDYEKQLRRRKRGRNIIIFLVVCIIILVLFNIYDKANLQDIKLPKINASNSSSKISNKKKGTSVAVKENKKVSSKNKKGEVKDKSLSVNLPDGKPVDLVYSETGNTRTMKSVDLKGLNAEYNISPGNKNVIIYEKDNQNMFFIDSNGNAQDITYKTYTSGGGTSFNKDNVLSSNAGYVWCASPRFVDDNTIVYVSQLPWFDNRQSKYVWKFNITDKSYVNTNLTGNDIKINSVTDKGIQIVIDGNTTYMKADGSTSN